MQVSLKRGQEIPLPFRQRQLVSRHFVGAWGLHNIATAASLIFLGGLVADLGFVDVIVLLLLIGTVERG